MSPGSPVNKHCQSEPPRPGTPETSAPIHPSSSLCNTVSTVTKPANLSLRLQKQLGASCSPALLYGQNQTLPYFNRWHSIRIKMYLYKLIQGHNPDWNVSDNIVFICTQHSCCCLVTVLLLDVGSGLPPRRGSKRRKQSYTWPLSSMLQRCVFLAITPSLSLQSPLYSIMSMSEDMKQRSSNTAISWVYTKAFKPASAHTHLHFQNQNNVLSSENWRELTYPKGLGLCVSKECNWQRLFFLLLGMESITSFNFDLRKKKL